MSSPKHIQRIVTSISYFQTKNPTLCNTLCNGEKGKEGEKLSLQSGVHLLGSRPLPGAHAGRALSWRTGFFWCSCSWSKKEIGTEIFCGRRLPHHPFPEPSAFAAPVVVIHPREVKTFCLAASKGYYTESCLVEKATPEFISPSLQCCSLCGQDQKCLENWRL